MQYKTMIALKAGRCNVKFCKATCLLIFCLLITGAFNTACAETLPGIAKLLPPETVLLIEIDNFQQLKQQFEKTNFYKLYKDPAMAEFVKYFEAKWKEKIRQSDNGIIAAFFDADVLPRGKVALAVVPGEKIRDINESSFLFIIQWGENSAKIKKAIEKVVNKAIENGSHKKSEDYRGVSIETIISSDKSKFNYLFIDDCLIGAVDIEVLKFVIAHIKGAGSRTLADDSDYSSTMSTVGQYRDINFYLNIKQIIKKIITEDTTEKAKGSIANLGLDNVVSMGCSIALARTPDTFYHARLIVKVNGAKKGICKMLEAESAVLRAPRFIPASVSSVTFFNLDIKKAYSELAGIMSGFSPESASILYMPLVPESPEDESAVYLKRDIIDHLGSQIITAQSINKPDSGRPATTEYIIALAVNDSRPLEKSMSLFHSRVIAPGQSDAKRELLGHTIYLFSFGALPFVDKGTTPMQDYSDFRSPKMAKLAFTITDTYIIFGTEAAVEKAIRTIESGTSASMSSAKWFNKAKANIPSVVGLASLEDDTVSTEVLWNMLKKTNKTQGSCAVSVVSPIQIDSLVSGLFDFTLLPDFEEVRKYFGLSTLYGISREDGFFFECKDIKPKDND